jgi:hypothetical protein
MDQLSHKQSREISIFGSHILECIKNSPGYSLGINLAENELFIFRKFIKKQWFSVIKSHSIEAANIIKEKKLNPEEYHYIHNFLDHSSVWRKQNRILGPDFHAWLKNSYFYTMLQKLFGAFEISDEENIGYPNIYWRLCRPGHSNDVGPIHRDSWFWESNPDFPKPNYNFIRYKVWIPIYTEPGLNGLLVEEDSHKRKDIEWKPEMRDGIIKPLLITKMDNLNMELLNTGPGNCVIFNDNLLHGGSQNNGENTRVSLEFTILALCEY